MARSARRRESVAFAGFALGLLTAACAFALSADARVVAGAATNFPPNQGLKLIEKDAPSWVGEPAVVSSVQTITSKRFGSVKNRFAHWVTWERPWRDAGKGKFLILRVKSPEAGCRYFLSLVDPSDRSALRRECTRLRGVDLSVYGKVSYQLIYREIRSNDRRWRAHEGEDKPLRRTSGRRISEYLDRGLLPGHYDVRIDVKVGLAEHPLLDFILEAKEWIDWVKTPFEVIEGPIGWTLNGIADEVIKGVVGALRTTRAVYAFDVPAVMPNLVGKTPFQASKLLRAFQLRPKLMKTTQPGKGVSKVIGQSEEPETWLLAGTEVTLTYVAYGPGPPTSAGPWHGDWRMAAIEDPPPKGNGTTFAPAGFFSFVQKGTKLCATWPWNAHPGGRLGTGGATLAAPGSTNTRFTLVDGAGTAVWDALLLDGGRKLGGRYVFTPRSGGKTIEGRIDATKAGSTPSRIPAGC